MGSERPPPPSAGPKVVSPETLHADERMADAGVGNPVTELFQLVLFASRQQYPAQRRKNLQRRSRIAVPHQRNILMQQLQTSVGAAGSLLPKDAEQNNFQLLFLVEQWNNQLRCPRMTTVQKRGAVAGYSFHQKLIIVANTMFQADFVLFHRPAERTAVQCVFRRKSACVAADPDALQRKPEPQSFSLSMRIFSASFILLKYPFYVFFLIDSTVRADAFIDNLRRRWSSAAKRDSPCTFLCICSRRPPAPDSPDGKRPGSSI